MRSDLLPTNTIDMSERASKRESAVQLTKWLNESRLRQSRTQMGHNFLGLVRPFPSEKMLFVQVRVDRKGETNLQKNKKGSQVLSVLQMASCPQDGRPSGSNTYYIGILTAAIFIPCRALVSHSSFHLCLPSRSKRTRQQDSSRHHHDACVCACVYTLLSIPFSQLTLWCQTQWWHLLPRGNNFESRT